MHLISLLLATKVMTSYGLITCACCVPADGFIATTTSCFHHFSVSSFVVHVVIYCCNAKRPQFYQTIIAYNTCSLTFHYTVWHTPIWRQPCGYQLNMTIMCKLTSKYKAEKVHVTSINNQKCSHNDSNQLLTSIYIFSKMRYSALKRLICKTFL